MLVKEIMNRTGIPSFGLVRMFIEDGLTEMNIMTKAFVKENAMSFFKGRRFYVIPEEAIGIQDILVKNHMNNRGEYRSIPRLLNAPKVKDVDGRFIRVDPNPDLGVVSDLDGYLNSLKAGSTIGDLDGKAREYAYYMVGDKIGLVEKEMYQDTTGDIVNDTDAYQKSSYRWVSVQQNGTGAIRLRYTYNPVYNIPYATGNIAQANSGNQYWVPIMSAMDGGLAAAITAGATHYIKLAAVPDATFDPITYVDLSAHNAITSGDVAIGKDIYISNAGYLTGLWRIKYLDMSGGYDNDMFLAPAQGRNAVNLNMSGGTITEILIALSGATALAHLRTQSLYSEQEDFHIPIARYQSLALVDYIKARVASENADIKTQIFFEAEFRKKLERHDSAKISGPRMVSPGPFALK